MRSFLVFFLLLGIQPIFSQVDSQLPNSLNQDQPTVVKKKEKAKIFRASRLTYQEYPYKHPSGIPSDFVPKGSDLIYSTELRTDRILEIKEAVVIFEHELSKPRIETYYETIFNFLNFKILQNQKSEAKTLYLVEGFNHKTVAISIEAISSGSKVKLFYRKSGGF
ncbi:hypothetical protein [Leptospira perolatii]|nr:hypothetical protein [Leptospira perolatii]